MREVITELRLQSKSAAEIAEALLQDVISHATLDPDDRESLKYVAMILKELQTVNRPPRPAPL